MEKGSISGMKQVNKVAQVTVISPKPPPDGVQPLLLILHFYKAIVQSGKIFDGNPKLTPSFYS